jgi:hypothetical protein
LLSIVTIATASQLRSPNDALTLQSAQARDEKRIKSKSDLGQQKCIVPVNVST